ncbi:hypothetical protein EYF80_048584 [Liparis tanakae]|uniref:Uncharacterized protein n=1 Tax=Liparis tanakae TaxID=230148 RepID=A0A4Z2FJC8_9TELE|nr:hypothetical protein EYF80_048584 [Liparis tanakae]
MTDDGLHPSGPLYVPSERAERLRPPVRGREATAKEATAKEATTSCSTPVPTVEPRDLASVSPGGMRRIKKEKGGKISYDYTTLHRSLYCVHRLLTNLGLPEMPGTLRPRSRPLVMKHRRAKPDRLDRFLGPARRPGDIQPGWQRTLLPRYLRPTQNHGGAIWNRQWFFRVMP